MDLERCLKATHNTTTLHIINMKYSDTRFLEIELIRGKIYAIFCSLDQLT